MDSCGVDSSHWEGKNGCDSIETDQNVFVNDTDRDDVAVNNTAGTIDVSSPSPSADKGPSPAAVNYSTENDNSSSHLISNETLSSTKSKEQCLEPNYSNGPVFPARHNGELMSPACEQGLNDSNSRSSLSPSPRAMDYNDGDAGDIENRRKPSFDYDAVTGENCKQLDLGLDKKQDIFKENDKNMKTSQFTDSEAREIDHAKCDLSGTQNNTIVSENESLTPLNASFFNCQYQTPSWIDDPLIGVPPSAMENKNTHRKTGADMRILTAYMRSLNEMRLPEAIPPEELDKYLSSFFLVVRKADGSEYEPCSLRAMLASIERYLRFKNYPLSLTRDSAFSNMRNVLKLKQQTLRSIGKGQKNQSEVTPSTLAREGKIAHLFKSQEMGPYTPSSLVFTLCFYFCMYLRLRKSTENKKLLWGDIVLCKDDSGREFLTFSSQMLRRTQGSSKLNLKQRSYRIWADPSCPEKDPITIYKFYEQKRPISMNVSMAPFYLGINVLYPTQGQLWYRPAAMGINKLNEMVRQIRDMTGIRSTSDFHGDIMISDKASEAEGAAQGEQSPYSESADRQEFENEPKQEIVDEADDENSVMDNSMDNIEPPLDCSQTSDQMHVSSHPQLPESGGGPVHTVVYSDGDSNDSFTPQSYPSSSHAGSATGEGDLVHEIDLSNSANSPLNCTTHLRDQRSAIMNGVFNTLPGECIFKKNK